MATQGRNFGSKGPLVRLNKTREAQTKWQPHRRIWDENVSFSLGTSALWEFITQRRVGGSLIE